MNPRRAPVRRTPLTESPARQTSRLPAQKKDSLQALAKRTDMNLPQSSTSDTGSESRAFLLPARKREIIRGSSSPSSESFLTRPTKTLITSSSSWT